MALSLSLHIGKFCNMPVYDGAHKFSDPYAIFFDVHKNPRTYCAVSPSKGTTRVFA